MSSEQVTVECIELGKRLEGKLNAYTVIDEEGALKAARSSDVWRKSGKEARALEGVPVCVKDAFCTVDLPTTCASRMLQGFQAGYDATAVKRLREAGAVIVGKNNMDEFCMGSSSTHSAHGPVVNPLGEGLTAGGSSGGTAAAVASGSAFAGIGSDTGGSVRQPAAMCGVVGFKPTYGQISRHGLVAMASSLDTVGILARNVEDCELLYKVLRGPDGLDSSQQVQQQEISRKIPYRVGVSNDFYPEEMNSELVSIWEDCALSLGWDGKQIISMPHTRDALPAYYVIASAEASSNLARYDGIRYGFRAQHQNLQQLYENTRTQGFGKEALRRILLGSFVLSRSAYDSFFQQAQKVRRLVAQDFERAFQLCDFLIVPTVPSGPKSLKQIQESSSPVEEYMGDLLTVSASLAGLPCISVPVAKSSSTGLPISMQIIGPRFHDQLVLQVASQLQQKQ